jgi:hypothetical protein
MTDHQALMQRAEHLSQLWDVEYQTLTDFLELVKPPKDGVVQLKESLDVPENIPSFVGWCITKKGEKKWKKVYVLIGTEMRLVPFTVADTKKKRNRIRTRGVPLEVFIPPKFQNRIQAIAIHEYHEKQNRRLNDTVKVYHCDYIRPRVLFLAHGKQPKAID